MKKNVYISLCCPPEMNTTLLTILEFKKCKKKKNLQKVKNASNGLLSHLFLPVYVVIFGIYSERRHT